MKRLMQWTYFLDILGYGEEQKNIDTQEKANIFIKFMEDNKLLIDEQEHMDKNSYKGKNFNIYDYYDFKSVFLSDSFVLTAIPKDALFNEEDYYNFSTFIVMELTFKILILLEHILVKKGLLLRGGISNKFTDINEESSLAVGQGLIEAYNLESNLAKVPRILLSQDISNDEKIMSYFIKHSKKYGESFSLFCKDANNDNLYYLDYLGFILAFLYKSENKRLNLQKQLEKKYAIDKNIMVGLNNLLIEQGSENIPEKLKTFFYNESISDEDSIKIIKMLKESSEIIAKIKDDVMYIQSIKTTTINTLKKLQEIIYSNLENHSGNEKVLKKYLWFKDYLNNTIEKSPNIEFIQEYKIIES